MFLIMILIRNIVMINDLGAPVKPSLLVLYSSYRIYGLTLVVDDSSVRYLDSFPSTTPCI